MEDKDLLQAPPKETPTTPQDWFKTEFGDVDVTVVKERFTNYDTLQSQLAEKETALQERERLLQEKDSALQSAYPDDFTKKLAELKKAGASPETIDAYWEINRKPHNELSPKEQVILQLKLEKGWSAKEAETYVNGIYGVDEADYLVLNEETGEKELSPKYQKIKELKELELKDRAGVASQFLQSYTAKHFDPQAEIQARKQQEQGYLSEVDSKFANFAFQGLSGVELLAADEKTGRSPIVLDLDNGEYSKQAPQIAKEYLINNRLAATPENIAEAGAFAEKVFYMNNGKPLLKTVAETAYNRGIADAVAQFENSGSVRKDPVGGTKPVDKHADAINNFVKAKSGK